MNSEDVRATIAWVKKNYAWRPGEDDEHVGQLIAALEASAVSSPSEDVRALIERVLYHAEQAVSDVGAWEEVAELVKILARQSPTAAVSTPPTITEPTRIALAARQGGKTQQTIDAMLDRANERGITVEIVPPQITDDMVERAARKMREFDDAESDVSWPSNRAYYIGAASSVLAAALHPGGETNG